MVFLGLKLQENRKKTGRKPKENQKKTKRKPKENQKKTKRKPKENQKKTEENRRKPEEKKTTAPPPYLPPREPLCGFCLFVFKWGEYKTRLDVARICSFVRRLASNSGGIHEGL